MNEFKSMIKSKTLWGVAVSIAAIVAGKYGLVIGDESAWVADIVALIAAVFAIYGRIVATKKLLSAV